MQNYNGESIVTKGFCLRHLCCDTIKEFVMSEWNLCYGCMESKSGESVCPHCGYDEHAAYLSAYLKPGTILHDRYLIGKELSHNGEGITYLAYDTNIGCKVLVREYMPEQLCARVQDKALINVNYNHLAQYKALMAEYTELNKSLARLRSLNHLNPALDLFAENNTTYAVFEYLEGRSLLEYLKENAGELNWQTVSRMFPQLFTTLSLLHNAGVLHRGISPETIFVTDKGSLKLCGFCISAVRTNDTELDAELFDGYAAPEQYFADRQQGTWTDVYGICAVLYRILTGCRATDANTRQDYDNLVPPNELNPKVPAHVSDGIMRGLALDGNERIRTITDLVTVLFEETTEEPAAPAPRVTPMTAPFHPGAVQQAAKQEERAAEHKRRHQETVSAKHQKEEKRNPLEQIRVPLLIAVLLLAIIAIIVMVFIKVFSKDNPGNPDSSFGYSSVESNIIEVSSTDSTDLPKYDSYMPLLVGKNYQIKKSEMAGWLEMEAEFEYNEEYAKDVIIWQELEKGAEFLSGSTIKVKVSLGSSKKVIPDFEGYQLKAYLKKLEDLGFVAASDGKTNQPTTDGDASAVKQKVIYKKKVDYNYANGFVCAVEPAVDTVINVLEDYTIVVYYAENPEVTTTIPAETTAPETTSTTLSQPTEEPVASGSNPPANVEE